MPRLDKLYALVEREVMRLYKNPSALMLIGLLVAFSVLLVLSRNDKKAKMVCWIVYPDSATADESQQTTRPEPVVKRKNDNGHEALRYLSVPRVA